MTRIAATHRRFFQGFVMLLQVLDSLQKVFLMYLQPLNLKLKIGFGVLAIRKHISQYLAERLSMVAPSLEVSKIAILPL